MKNPGIIFLAVLFSGVIIVSSSCSTKSESVYGNLNVKVLDTLGNPVSGALIYLAKEYQHLNSSAALRTGWTDNTGNAKFTELAPGYYWYGAQYYVDGGAVQVYSGVDEYVILVLNSQEHPKK